jgi:hypothetical protein
MNTEEPASIPPEVLKEMEDAVRIAYSNVRDPTVMKTAGERMDRRAEKNRQLFGVQDIGVNIIGEMRDSR